MNVLRVQIAVLRRVQILLGVTHVHVVQAIVWQVMGKHAMVSLMHALILAAPYYWILFAVFSLYRY